MDPAKLAATGQCAGGDFTYRTATMAPDLRAVAPMYGQNPPLEDVPSIRAAVFGAYGELDTRINQGIPALEAALQEAGITYRITIYPNARHAFFNEYRPDSYEPAAATQAWHDMLDWFSEHLGLAA